MRFPRSSGVLLHPTSLPGPHGSGDFGPAAYHFIDWLVVAGQKLWQILPLGPVGLGNSPYMSLSAFAGNPLLIDLSELEHKGWLRGDELSSVQAFPTKHIDFGKVVPFRPSCCIVRRRSFSSTHRQLIRRILNCSINRIKAGSPITLSSWR